MSSQGHIAHMLGPTQRSAAAAAPYWQGCRVACPCRDRPESCFVNFVCLPGMLRRAATLLLLLAACAVVRVSVACHSCFAKHWQAPALVWLLDPAERAICSLLERAEQQQAGAHLQIHNHTPAYPQLSSRTVCDGCKCRSLHA